MATDISPAAADAAANIAQETGGNLATVAGAVTSSIVQENVKQVNGVVPLMGNGTTGTGSQRVTIASDNTAFPVNSTLSAETTKVIGVTRTADGTGNLTTSTGGALDVNLKTSAVSNQSTNEAQINGVTPLMGNGVSGTGSQRVNIASDNTPFPVKTDQTTHGTTDLVAADITKVAGSAISQGHGTAATAVRVELPTDGTGIVGLGTGTNSVGKVSDITTSVTPGTGSANLGKAEDAAHVSGDTGVFALGVRNNTASALAGTDGDYIPLTTDTNGGLWVSLATLIAGEDITNNLIRTEEQTTYTQISASTLIKSGAGRLKGIFVSAASATPTIKIWDNTSAATTVLIDTFTPVAATPYIFPFTKATTGIFVTISGTVSCTIFWN